VADSTKIKFFQLSNANIFPRTQLSLDICCLHIPDDAEAAERQRLLITNAHTHPQNSVPGSRGLRPSVHLLDKFMAIYPKTERTHMLFLTWDNMYIL
jgi:hypothetical protein